MGINFFGTPCIAPFSGIRLKAQQSQHLDCNIHFNTAAPHSPWVKGCFD